MTSPVPIKITLAFTLPKWYNQHIRNCYPVFEPAHLARRKI